MTISRGVMWVMAIGLLAYGVSSAAEPKFADGVSVQRFVEVDTSVKPSHPQPKLPDGMQAHEDVVYCTVGDRALKLDLYVPKGDGPLPGVVLVHGGGWIGGNKESFRPMAQRIAAAGFVTATIEYRLATEAQFPAAVEDCKAAVRWMRAHAEAYHVDRDRIGAVGGSAGGHLVAMLATTGKSRLFEGSGGNADQRSDLQATAMMGAGVDQVTRAKETKNPIKSQLLFFGGKLDEKADVYAAASPITHISKDTPPLLFIEGEFDSPGQRYIEMRRQLDALGVPNQLIVIQGAKHGVWNSNPWFEPFTDNIIGFLKQTLVERHDK
ncbi:MAG: alpha/beta hydrolase fold domain-containing protein [Phycisphaera sp.]|nr:alpha/beta hydrolase fold domain-containing protein [Phycisphaera sp.]